MEQLGLEWPTGAPLSLGLLVANLGIGLVLALALRWHFERFGSTLSNRAEFAQVFPFILLTTVLIITVVKSSLALSLGLVGALSIVRFRTPVKEPEELAYLFMAIAMGLGLGANQTLPTVVAAVLILTAVGVLRRGSAGRETKNLYLSLEWPASGETTHPLQTLSAVIARHVTAGDLRRAHKRNGALEVTYFVDVPHADNISALLEDLEQSFPGLGVTFIDQNQMPSI
jgi:hypothetical protein